MAKSPVYGLGRNIKHRPKKTSFHPSAGNINMRGKKEKRMGCGCCVCIDLRDNIKKEITKKILKTLK